jgi:hypothetical protein
MADKGKFTPIAVTKKKWPNLLDARSNAINKAKELYGVTEEHNARGDAYRHLVWQALTAKRYGDSLASAMGNYHELGIPAMMGGAGINPDPDEVAMDKFNNQLGRQIAKEAKTEEDVYRLAQEYIDSGKAKYMSMPEVIYKSRLAEQEEESAY